MRYKQPYTLFKRGKYWYFRTYDNRGVRTTAHSTGQTSKSAAKLFCDNLYLNGSLNQSNITFRKYAEHFIDDDSMFITDRPFPMSINSIKLYRVYLRILIEELGQLPMSDIDYITLKTFRGKLLQNYSTGYVKGIFAFLDKIFKYAVRSRLINSNPCEVIETLKVVDGDKDAFTREEVKALYSETSYKDTVLLMALTGMRTSEALCVRASDLTVKDGVNFIHLTAQCDDKGNRIPLKSKFSKTLERYIPIIPELVPICERNEFHRLVYMSVQIKKITSKFTDNEKRKLSLYSCRHFFITDAKSHGVIESKVETIAGHKLKGITNVYTNYHAEDLTDILAWQLEVYNFLNSQEDEKNGN